MGYGLGMHEYRPASAGWTGGIKGQISRRSRDKAEIKHHNQSGKNVDMQDVRQKEGK